MIEITSHRQGAILNRHHGTESVKSLKITVQGISESGHPVKVNGVPQYPQFAWGANPDSVNGVACDVNSTVSKVDTKYAYAGDFENAFKWGYADVVNFEVIEYGDPDNTGSDLKGHNQVYLRAEAWIGWAILDGAAFARIEESDESGS